MNYRDTNYIVPTTRMRGPETEAQYFERMMCNAKALKKSQAREQRQQRILNWLENTGRKLRFEASPFYSKHA